MTTSAMGDRQMLPVQMNATRIMFTYAGAKEVVMVDSPKDPEERTKNGWTIAVGVAVILLLWFAIINSRTVAVHFWITTFRAPVVVVIAVSAVFGAAIIELWRRARH